MFLAGIQSPGFELGVYFIDWMTGRYLRLENVGIIFLICFLEFYLIVIEHCVQNIEY